MFVTDPSTAAVAIVEQLARCWPTDAEASTLASDDGAHEVLLHLESLSVTDSDGWRVCELELESCASGRSRVQFALHTSVNELGDRVRACATLCDPPTALHQRRADDVQATLWDALMGCAR